MSTLLIMPLAGADDVTLRIPQDAQCAVMLSALFCLTCIYIFIYADASRPGLDLRVRSVAREPDRRTSDHSRI